MRSPEEPVVRAALKTCWPSFDRLLGGATEVAPSGEEKGCVVTPGASLGASFSPPHHRGAERGYPFPGAVPLGVHSPEAPSDSTGCQVAYTLARPVAWLRGSALLVPSSCEGRWLGSACWWQRACVRPKCQEA